MRAFVVLRGALALIAAIPLGACAARDPIVSNAYTKPSGNWKVERQTDRITGAPLSSALLNTRTVSNSSVPFAPPATLQLACFKGQPLVRIAFDFKVGSTRNSEFGYRFDEKPGREINARFVADYKTVVIEDSAEVAQFLGELADSNVLYIRIRSINAGRSSAEFHVDGAPGAIDAALAGCKPASNAPKQRAASR